MNKLIYEKIEALLSKKAFVTLAIDGMCASGKTTLANEIKAAFGGTVISADSFFLPSEMRSEKRMNEPGGNFHRERFAKEIINNIGEPVFTYGCFDCGVGEVTKSVTVQESSLIIIEGSYCMHPKLNAEYDFKIFTLTDGKTQLNRIKKRNGEENAAAFVNKWIPFENRYFEFYNIKNECDSIIFT